MFGRSWTVRLRSERAVPIDDALEYLHDRVGVALGPEEVDVVVRDTDLGLSEPGRRLPVHRQNVIAGPGAANLFKVEAAPAHPRGVASGQVARVGLVR